MYRSILHAEIEPPSKSISASGQFLYAGWTFKVFGDVNDVVRKGAHVPPRLALSDNTMITYKERRSCSS
jgi:hypothetical protein